MHSYWEKKYWFKSTDFTIVGSGLVGLLTSIYLKERFPKATVRILEREAVPKGASTRNAGFACFGAIGELLDDLSSVDEQEVVNTLEMRYKGLQLLRATIPDAQMDFKLNGGFEVFCSRDNYEHCAETISKMNGMVFSATGLKQTFMTRSSDLRLTHPQMIFNQYEGQLNPVMLVQALRNKARALDVDICSGFTLDKWELVGSSVHISLLDSDLQLHTHTLVLATNAFTSQLLPQLDILPKRNQVLVSQPLDSPLKGTYHFDRGYVYFRNIDGRVLIGGARNIDPDLESTDSFRPNDKVITHLKEFAKKYISEEFEIDHQWSGIIATGDSKSPIVKKLSGNVFAAVRLGGMGVAIGAQVARQVVEKIA